MSENQKRNLSNIINNLSKNVMFRLSLGSKELFHSNFWAFLLEEYGNKATKIFQEECDNGICDVYREMSHTDLSFKSNGELIIIENKFKSYPDLEQLKRYAFENKNRNFKQIILVSFYEPTFLSDIEINKLGNGLFDYNGEFKFKYLSYTDILNNLKNFYNEVHSEHKTYVNGYIDMLQSLIELKEYLSMEKNPEKTFISFIKDIKDNEEKAKDFNFDVTIQKIFCNNLMTSILKNLNTKLCKWGACNYASRARHVYMDIFVSTPNLGVMKDMGLQLVCRDFENLRKYVHVDKENHKDIRNEIDIENEYNWFFENTYGGKNKKFLGYEYKDDAWLYRTCNSDLNNYKINDFNFNDIKDLYNQELKIVEEKYNLIIK